MLNKLKNIINKYNKYLFCKIIFIEVDYSKINISLKYNNKEFKLIFLKKDFYNEKLYKNVIKTKYFYISFDKRVFSNNFDIKNFYKDIILLDKFLLDIYKRTERFFYYENYFLNLIINLDKKLSKKNLIYVEGRYKKTFDYLFYYNKFDNLVFTDGNNEIDLKSEFDKIIIISNSNSDLLLKNLKNGNTKYKKIISILLGSSYLMPQQKSIYYILKNMDNVEIFPNTHISTFLEYIKAEDKDIFKRKINKSYIYKSDQFGFTSRLIKIYEKENYEKQIDLLINCGPARNYEIILENYEFFKDIKCVFHNIKHKSTDSINLSKLINKNNNNHIFIEHLSEIEYSEYLNKTKVLFIPSYRVGESLLTNATWLDALLYGKHCIISENKRVLEFKKYNALGIPNFETFSNMDEMKERIKTALSDKDYIRKSGNFGYESFINDLSFERLLLDLFK